MLESHAARALAELPRVCGSVERALDWARDVGRWAPSPGGGWTRRLWEFFAEVAAVDVAAARVLEPHLDALAILRQAGTDAAELGPLGAGEESTWGVFAAEGPGATLTATRDGERWLLDGTKPWCSLAGSLSHALVTASVGGNGGRRLFAVALGAPGVTADAGPWVPRGLTQIVSAPVHFARVPAVPVGGAGWYLERPGFFWGGIGVAACWLGGAIGIARTLAAAARHREPDQLALAHLGAVDAELAAGRAVIAQAAERADAAAERARRATGPGAAAQGTAAQGTAAPGTTAPEAAGADWPIVMLRARNLVAAVVEDVIARAGHALGPGPLALDEAHAARVADLQLYVRQHHAERDDAALGRALLDNGAEPGSEPVGEPGAASASGTGEPGR